MHETSSQAEKDPPGGHDRRDGAFAGQCWLAAYRGMGRMASIGALAMRRWARFKAHAERAEDLGERLVLDSAVFALPKGAVWLHAASVGEVRAIAPLSSALARHLPNHSRFLTVQTRTGRDTARRDFDLPVRLAPLDERAAVRRFLDAAAPSLYVVVETEIWPCLLEELARRGIPAALVSARLSPEKWPRYRRAASLYALTLANLTRLCPASDADRERFLELGCPARIIGPTGNLKWDGAPVAVGADERQRLADELALGEKRRWIVCGSVHPGETSALIEALEDCGHARHFLDGSWGLLIAPRHPHRFDEIAAEIEATGWPLRRLSQERAADRPALLVDRLGLLRSLYALSEAAVLGGTLVPVGGHTPLEAAAAACPLASGPHHGHAADLLVPLARAGGAILADDADGMARTLGEWIANDDARRLAGDAALSVVRERRGHADRVANMLGELLR